MVRNIKFNAKIAIQTSLGVACLFIYCEYVIYYVVLRECDWPKLDATKADTTIKTSFQDPVRFMVLADTHLLGSRRGHWFDKLRREWQMHRAFQTAIHLLKPELVFVLGDLTDEGSISSDDEFYYHVNRFQRLFAVPEGTKMYVAVGNHDIGFHYVVSPYLNQRFVKAFNSTPVQMVSLRGNHFVIINSMALEGDGCFLCKPVEQQLTKIEKTFKCSKGTYPGTCPKQLKLETYSRPILMQHYPLYRKSDIECQDFDAAPSPIREERFRERWECLSREATLQILNQIQPRLALSGHTHHGCTRKLPVGDGIEITIPSFSWRNKENPNFGLGVVTPNNYAFIKCPMPKESTILVLYIFGGFCLLIWIYYSIFRMRWRRKYKYR